jgi:hypothetical protein
MTPEERHVIDEARLPPDLLAVRVAADRVGVTDKTLRSYIYEGRHGKKLRTYRMPFDPNMVLVSLAEVVRFSSESLRQPHKLRYESPPPQVVLRCTDEVGRALLFLREAAIARLGCKITYTALLEMLILEAARTRGWKNEPAIETDKTPEPPTP